MCLLGETLVSNQKEHMLRVVETHNTLDRKVRLRLHPFGMAGIVPDDELGLEIVVENHGPQVVRPILKKS